jgi:hypothetical protein
LLRCRAHQQKQRRDEPPLRESSVDTEAILVEAAEQCGAAQNRAAPVLTSTVVGVGLGGKTCISVNDGNDSAVKIWTSTSNVASGCDAATTTYVQTTAIVHPSPSHA